MLKPKSIDINHVSRHIFSHYGLATVGTIKTKLKTPVNKDLTDAKSKTLMRRETPAVANN